MSDDVDADRLRREVRDKYRDVALEPDERSTSTPDGRWPNASAIPLDH